MSKSSPRPKRLQNKTVVLIVSGSIAAYKTPDLVRLLREQGARVMPVMTRAAEHFITPLVLRAVTDQPVLRDFFSPDVDHGVIHTSLAEDSDLILAAPASANLIARLAAGMADDLATCLVLATRKPVVIAPAMNDQMYLHELTQANIAKLKSAGYRFVAPVEGRLICGREAVGHIASPETILDFIFKTLKV